MSGDRLLLDPPHSRGAGGPGPTRPTLINPGPGKPLQFADVDALARHIHRQRGRRGLRLIKGVASYAGSDTFPVFRVNWLEEDTERYAFTVAVQDLAREAFEATIAATNPDVPS